MIGLPIAIANVSFVCCWACWNAVFYLDLLEDTKESRDNGRSYCLGDCFHCHWFYQRDMVCFGWLMLRGYFFCPFSFEVVIVEAGLGMSL